MKDQGKRHTAIFTKMLALMLLDRGFEVETIFRGTGFDAGLLEEDAPTAYLCDSLDFFERAAMLTKNSNLGFQLGKAHGLRRTGFICYVGLTSPTVGSFLENFTRYSRVMSSPLEIEKSQLWSDGILDWDYVISPSQKRRQYVEFTSACLMRTLRHFADKEIIPQSAKFKHNRRSHREELDTYYGCTVEYGAARNGIKFVPSDMDLPLISADPELLGVLQSHGDQALAKMGRNPQELIVDVERKIVDQLGSEVVTLDTVAASFGMSPHTLTRKLEAEGTTFFQLLDDLRNSLAKSYLRDSDLVVIEIAFLLGFSGIISFNDAFKRWTGSSPEEFRAA